MFKRGLRVQLGLAMTILVVLVVAACGGGDPTSTPGPTATAPPRATPTPAPTPTPEPPPTPAADEPKRGGTLEIGIRNTRGATGHFIAVPARIGVDATSFAAAHNIFNQLIIRDPYKGQALGGDLAESWTVTNDGTRYTFRIPRGVTWHDGTPLTSRDVLYSFEAAMNPPEGYQPTRTPVIVDMLGLIVDLRTPDDFTFEINTSAVSASFLARMTWGGSTLLVMPSHVDLDTVDEAPVGSGPFKFTGLREGIDELEANPTYFKKDPEGRDLPYLDGLQWFAFSDTSLGLSAFRTGRIKYIDLHNTELLEGQHQTLVRDIPGLQLDNAVLGVFGVIMKNIPPWDDPRVREAMDLWLNRKEIVDTQLMEDGYAFGGRLVPESLGGKWDIPISEWMQRPGQRLQDAQGNVITSEEERIAKWDELIKVPADRERARELLAQAGIQPGDIQRTIKSNIIASERGYITTASQLSELFGTTWELEVDPTRAALTVEMRAGTFDIVYVAFGGANLDDPSAEGADSFGTASHFYKGYGWQPGPNQFALFEEQDRILDEVRRKEIAGELVTGFADARSSLFVNWLLGRAPSYPEVKNRPDGVACCGNYFNVEKVWLDE